MGRANWSFITSMQAGEERAVERGRAARRLARDLAVTAEPTSLHVIVERTADSFSARLLAAEEDRQPAAVLEVRGELDLVTAPVLLEVLLFALERGTGPLVVDLSEVPFMDSTGVHVLIDTLRRLEPQDRGLVITCREHGQVHRLLGLVGLLDAVTVQRPGRARGDAAGSTIPQPLPLREQGVPLNSGFADAPARQEEADLAGPTIALAMARTREPARPAVLSPAQWLGNHARSARGS